MSALDDEETTYLTALDEILDVDDRLSNKARAELAALRARETCTGCGSPKISAILAVIGGAAACCPDCSTLTVEERNAIRARVAAAEAPKTCATCDRYESENYGHCQLLGIFITSQFGCTRHAPKEKSE